MIKYIAKANNDGISHCACSAPLASAPGQLDCPWCGCGWLICCTECGKAFTYGKVVEVDATYEGLIRADYERRGFDDITDDEIQDEARMMADILAGFAIGETIIYLDGCYLPLAQAPIAFDGVFASHSFDRLPHADALQAPERLSAALGVKSYWLAREKPDRDVD